MIKLEQELTEKRPATQWLQAKSCFATPFSLPGEKLQKLIRYLRCTLIARSTERAFPKILVGTLIVRFPLN